MIYLFLSQSNFKTVCEQSIKAKGLPQQAEVAQGVPGRLSSRICLTFVRGMSSAIRTGRFYPRYSFLEAESTPGHMVPSVATEKKSPVTPPGIDPETVRLVAQCLNHYATPGREQTITTEKFSISGGDNQIIN